MPPGKIATSNPNKGGRPKGSVNRVTASAKSMIEQCATELGGATRMVAWAKEAPENERAFWSNIFTKLMPLQVNGPGANGEHRIITEIVTTLVAPAQTDT